MNFSRYYYGDRAFDPNIIIFNDMKYFVEHPELMEATPEGIRFDKECEYHETKPLR